MPTYDYACNQCGHRFEAFQRMSDEPLKTCPDCGGDVQRLISGGTGLIFKGSGFYITDYKGNANGKSESDASGGKSDSSTESKPESPSKSKPGKKKPPESTNKKTTND